jgi:hypothetical protein
MLYCNIVKRTQEEILHGRCFTDVQHDEITRVVEILLQIGYFWSGCDASLAFSMTHKQG